MRDQENIRLRMELQASAKEAKVLATELEECRTEARRLEEAADEYQLSSDQAQALEKQESEAEKMARDGPGGNVGRLSREVEELSLKLKQATTERDNANHGHKAMELSARRQQAQWEQEHVQTNTQLEALGRRVKQERVKAAEESEGGSKSELASLLDAHDQLQGKWRAASKEVHPAPYFHVVALHEFVMATQSARAVEEARAANVRLERRCQDCPQHARERQRVDPQHSLAQELNEALVSALSDKAASVAHEEQQDRRRRGRQHPGPSTHSLSGPPPDCRQIRLPRDGQARFGPDSSRVPNGPCTARRGCM
ncbi:hypothetical protein T484DRAFT_1750618 [Baffinella frigidus]|nr:hypothetical protein T484DRAFT_1750618 [Cryptophyta sp. CCMP2293]